jgi:hypothetical protein
MQDATVSRCLFIALVESKDDAMSMRGAARFRALGMR